MCNIYGAELKVVSLQIISVLHIFETWKLKLVFLKHLTITGVDYNDAEMDKEFLLELRELKVLLDREKDHKQ